jgi:cob(I)alamin adenosyltransferase
VKIYTKTGDDGRTGLLGPGRFSKSDLRIEAYGSIDELNALIGVALADGSDPDPDGWLAQVQHDLFAVGSSLADPNPEGKFHNAIGTEPIARLERGIDAMEENLPPLSRFILPGGSPEAARIHLARTVCRRAERAGVRLAQAEGEHVAENVLIYLNRLSDFLFVLARDVNARAGVDDVPWKGLTP